MRRTPRAVAVGAVCATRIFRVDSIPPPPAKVLASALCELYDGMALSAACAFARLGGQAAVWARTGDDAQGRALRQAVQAEGLDVDGLRAVPGSATSQAAVVVDARGERLVVPFHDPQVDASPAWLPLQQLGQADIVLADVRWLEGAEAVLRAAQAAGVPAMLDAEVGPLAVLQRLVPLASHKVFSDAGLLHYTGLASVDEALLAVAAQQGGHVGASCGAAGYAWADGGRVRRVPAPVVQVVDTLAAGDVFHGALALGLAEGRPVDEAARFACHAATLKCTRFGGRLGCPDRAEVEASLASG